MYGCGVFLPLYYQRASTCKNRRTSCLVISNIQSLRAMMWHKKIWIYIKCSLVHQLIRYIAQNADLQRQRLHECIWENLLQGNDETRKTFASVGHKWGGAICDNKFHIQIFKRIMFIFIYLLEGKRQNISIRRKWRKKRMKICVLIFVSESNIFLKRNESVEEKKKS